LSGSGELVERWRGARAVFQMKVIYTDAVRAAEEVEKN